MKVHYLGLAYYFGQVGRVVSSPGSASTQMCLPRSAHLHQYIQARPCVDFRTFVPL
jgi:hypothetical protein